MKFDIKNKKVLVVIAVISALSIGGIALNNKSKDNINNYTESQFVELYSVSGGEKVYINGTITPKKTETYYRDSSLGEIEKVNVNSGEIVDKGYLLYSYKNTQKEEEVKENEVELKSKEADLVLLKKNPEENVVDIKVLQKEISALKNKITKLKSEIITKVTAPFSGVVYLEDELNTADNQGAFLTIDSKEYYVEGIINERDLSKVKNGMGTNIHVFSLEEDRSGKVTYISKRPISLGAEQSNLSQYKVRIEFDNQENLVSGFHVQAKIDISNEKIEIPVSAIFTEEEQQYVLVEEDGFARKQAIEAEIIENDTLATVISGLSYNDTIVKDVENSNLKDGDEINPENNTKGGEIVDSIQF